MDHANMLKIICHTAATTLDDRVTLIRQKMATETAHLNRRIALEETERQYMEEHRGYPETAEPMRTPTPLSERGVSTTPTPPPRPRRVATQATRKQKKEWRMGGLYDSKGQKVVAPAADVPSTPVAEPSNRKRGRQDPDSDAEDLQSPKRPVKRRAGPPKGENERVMGGGFPRPMTRSRTSGALMLRGKKNI